MADRTHDYPEVDGTPLARKHKLGDGSYRWEHADGTPGRPESVRNHLYGADLVVKTGSEGGEIHVTEGEHDADSLRELGLTATCSPDGCTWRDPMADLLAEASLITIYIDNDEPGQRYGRAVRRSLKARGVKCRVLRTPLDHKGADVTDHLNAGLHLEALVEELLDEMSAPLWVDIADVTAATVEELFLIPGVLCLGGIAVVAALPKSWKTWVCEALAISLVTGVPFMGHEVLATGDVLYVTTETGASSVAARASSLALGLGLRMEDLRGHFRVWDGPVDLLDESVLDDLRQAASGCRAVFIDVLRNAWSGDENSDRDIARLVANLRTITQAGTTVVLVHHFGKSSEDVARRGGERLRGSSHLFASLDSLICLTARNGRVWVTMQHRDGAPAPDFDFVTPDHHVMAHEPVVLGIAQDVVDHTDVLTVVVNSPGITKGALANAVGGNRTKALRQIDQAEREGLLRFEQVGRARHYHLVDVTKNKDEAMSVPICSVSVPEPSESNGSLVPSPYGEEPGTTDDTQITPTLIGSVTSRTALDLHHAVEESHMA